MTDAEIRAQLHAAPDTPVIRLTEPGTQRYWHNCPAQQAVDLIPVDKPLCSKPDGNRPVWRCFTGRCPCGAIVVSLPSAEA